MKRASVLRGKKKEFSQCLVIVSWTVTIVWITSSFILAFFGKDPNSEVTVTLIKESFGVTLAYYLYQASLKISRNIHKVDPSGVPYSIKQRVERALSPENSEDNYSYTYTEEPDSENTGL